MLKDRLCKEVKKKTTVSFDSDTVVRESSVPGLFIGKFDEIAEEFSCGLRSRIRIVEVVGNVEGRENDFPFATWYYPYCRA